MMYYDDEKMLEELKARRRDVYVRSAWLVLSLAGLLLFEWLAYRLLGEAFILCLAPGAFSLVGITYLALGLKEAILDLKSPFRGLIHSASDSEDRRVYRELSDRYNAVRRRH